MSKLLVVDDEQAICWGISRLGKSLGHDVVTASSAEEGLALAEEQPPDAIILDVRLPGMDGLTAMQHFRHRAGPVPIVVVTAYGDLHTAVEAVRNGAFDYLVKPFDLEQVQAVVTRALLRVPDEPLDQEKKLSVAELIGSSPAMQHVFKRIALAASSEASVLLSGESGTGKELAARAIHRFGLRADRPFVAVNVASLSPSLVESELFGHARGSFTGADETRTGLLAQANGGTLFLDEVADVPLPVQVKLLRALESGEVTPVGSNTAVESNFRLISASHQDLLEMVDKGQFRHDLYFRLCAFRIDMPPLRERPDDVVTLSEHFLSKFSASGARPQISAAFRQELQGRQWSGNVRELRNAIEHAVVLARGGILLPEHLPAPVAPPRGAKPQHGPEQIGSLIGQWAAVRLTEGASEAELYTEFLQLVEPPLLRRVLQHSRGQCLAAARRLGLHRTTLKKKLDQYGIDDTPDAN